MAHYPEKLINTSGDLVIQEAERRGITVVRFPEADVHTVFLEHHGHHEPLYYSRTDHQGSVAVKIVDNKAITTALLRRAGFPVPSEVVTASMEEATTFLANHHRVVVKPLGNTGGIGVTPDITTPEQLARAVTRARTASVIKNEANVFVVQQHVVGNDYRILVINQQQLFAIHRIPAQVIGDGQQTVAELVVTANKTRHVKTHIHFSEAAEELLQEQAVTKDSIPAMGDVVRLERVANYHAGGTLRDVTAELHPQVQHAARAIAKYFNLGIIGIDCLSPDIAQGLGFIIELNGTPDLTIHHFPHHGTPRDAAGAVVDMLFPATAR